MNDEETVEDAPASAVQRLCNEIQLFDLCDLNSCCYKDGRFCTNSELVAAFERISDAETVRREARISEDLEEGEEGFDEEYDEAYDEREFDDEAESEDDF
jgi:hypothetical protein